jgi:subtilisin family serine protease
MRRSSVSRVGPAGIAGLAAFAVSLSTAAGAAPSIDERFGPRRYRQAEGRVVPVSARSDLLVVRTALPPDEVATLVERAVELVVGGQPADPALRVAGARLVADHGLVAVELAGDAPKKELVAVARALAAHPAVLQVYPALSRMTGRAFADDRLLVTAERGQLDAVLPTVLEKTAGTLIKRSLLPDTALVAVGAPFSFDAVEASARLGELPGLRAAEPDLYRELALKATTLNDPLFENQWHLSRRNDAIPGTGQVFADEAWDITLGTPDVVIAVFDTGIDVEHPDLLANLIPGFDAASNDDDPSPACSASFDGRGRSASCPERAPFRESHGTSVAGAAAAVGDNGIGVAGVCPRCSIMPVRLIADRSVNGLTIAETFQRAIFPAAPRRGADIVNNSWGPGFSLFFPLSTAERDVFSRARTEGRDGRGAVIVFAAGNDTSDVGSDAYAADPHTIAVAAVTNLDDWALYSNYGSQIDIAAPSQGLPSNQDGIADDDFGILTTDVTGDDGYDPSDYNDGFGGTSAASPVTAGVIGLVLSANPQLTSEQVRLVLTSTADKILADKMPWQALIGQDVAAIFAYDETGHSIGFGYGRVNARRAVEAASTPGLLGGPCSAAGCTFCSAEERCLTRCERQSDCPDGSVCNAGLGACELPRDRPADFLSPCSADCAFCTPTLDTEFGPVDICTIECGNDDDCPDGFDCRLTELGGPSICGVGDKGAGEPADFFSCFSPQIGTSLVVVTDSGRELCGDVCFGDGPGACPFGFTCRTADCECTGGGNFGCFEFTCVEDDNPAFDNNDFFFPICLPDPGFADRCSTDLECQTGDYCVDGRCRLDDREGCDICNTCTSNEDCLGRGVCIGLRGDGIGECVWACGDTDPCPGDSVCRAIENRFGDLEVCISPRGGRTEADRCDPDYTCKVACRDDVPCRPGQVCEAGTCVAAPPEDPDLPPGVSGGGCTCASGSGLPFGLALLALGAARRARASKTARRPT